MATRSNAELRAGAGLLAGLTLSACASLTGYPSDPANDARDTAGFANGFGSAVLNQYAGSSDTAQRKTLRDQIILDRLASYDVAFKAFERQLASQTNSISMGGDLTALALTGLAGTVANAGTKTALAAASTGVQGANAKISKDLFYQTALPAMLTQMEANRASVLKDIIKGMVETDAQYPLAMALHDIERYANAGSIPAAISVITKSATDTKAKADADISRLRTLNYEGTSTTTTKLINWLFPSGDQTKPPVPTNLTALLNWMQNDTVDPKLAQLPYELLLNGDDPSMESDRARAVMTLIPDAGK